MCRKSASGCDRCTTRLRPAAAIHSGPASRKRNSGTSRTPSPMATGGPHSLRRAAISRPSVAAQAAERRGRQTGPATGRMPFPAGKWKRLHACCSPRRTVAEAFYDPYNPKICPKNGSASASQAEALPLLVICRLSLVVTSPPRDTGRSRPALSCRCPPGRRSRRRCRS